MNARDIAVLYAFNRWANSRLLTSSASLPADQFARDLGASHGSLHETWLHILWGEWLWLQRWRGESPKRRFDRRDFPDLGAIRAHWSLVERHQQDFIDDLADERLLEQVAYENIEGQRWEYPLQSMLQHVANHSSYHRGQVATLLRQLGRIPPATDFLIFFDEQGRVEDRLRT